MRESLHNYSVLHHDNVGGSSVCRMSLKGDPLHVDECWAWPSRLIHWVVSLVGVQLRRTEPVGRIAIRLKIPTFAPAANKGGRLAWCAALVLFLSSSALAADVDTVLKGLQADIAKARAELAAVRERNTKARLALRKEAADLETALAAEERNIEAAHAKDKDLFKQRGELQVSIAKDELELSRMRRSLIENRKELQAVMLHSSRPAPSFTELDNLLQTKPIPTEAQRKLLAFYDMHWRASAATTKSAGEAALPNGSVAKGEMLWIGGLGTLFKSDAGEVGIALRSGSTGEYRLAAGALSTKVKQQISSAFAGGDTIAVPLDISDGKGLAQLRQQRTIIEFLKAGGPVVIPLLLIAVAAVIVALERAYFLLRVDSNVDRLLGRVMPLVESGNFDEALKSAGENGGPVHCVIRTGLEQGANDPQKLEEILQESILAQLPRLERFLSALGVMAAVAPLLGLLGTVSGMIGTFQIITIHGTGNARLMSGGISEALITTEIGLIVAVPILLAHSWLNRRVRVIIGHMDRAAISLTGGIREANRRKP